MGGVPAQLPLVHGSRHLGDNERRSHGQHHLLRGYRQARPGPHRPLHTQVPQAAGTRGPRTHSGAYIIYCIESLYESLYESDGEENVSMWENFWEIIVPIGFFLNFLNSIFNLKEHVVSVMMIFIFLQPVIAVSDIKIIIPKQSAIHLQFIMKQFR